ncbi:hypothetical protein BKA69DRAFT_731924 [Paraphysoderma sedebokerense]|nr:hypothetical protein BKA69DRAFT_731924 [Paraphysoderma sedebokerense]
MSDNKPAEDVSSSSEEHTAVATPDSSPPTNVIVDSESASDDSSTENISNGLIQQSSEDLAGLMVLPTLKATGETREVNPVQDEPSVEIETELTQVIRNLETGDSPLSTSIPPTIRDALIRLHDLLLNSRENERKLVGKVKQLSTELNESSTQIQEAIKSSQADKASVKSLTKELKKAWKLLEQGNEKEAKHKDVISELRSEVATLTKQIQASKSLAPGQEHSLMELIEVIRLWIIFV